MASLGSMESLSSAVCWGLDVVWILSLYASPAWLAIATSAVFSVATLDRMDVSQPTIEAITYQTRFL